MFLKPTVSKHRDAVLWATVISSVALTLPNINYGAFAPTATYSIANQLGVFASAGINVTFLQIRNSSAGYASLLNGAYDVIIGTVDNAVNLRFNAKDNITVLGQLDQGPDLVLASVPSITSVQELRGKPLIVDSAASGYSFLLRTILGLYGLQLGTDCTFQVVGASSLRYGYLKAGQLPNGTAVYATILTYPFTAKGEALPLASGPNILARASDFVNPISARASAITATGASLTNATKTASITKFMTGLLEANAFLSQPQNKLCAVKAIAQQLDVSTAVATQEYAAATNPETGETATMQDGIFNVSRQGLLNVIDMRQLVGGFAGAGTEFDFVDAIVPGPGNFIDYTIRDAALKAAWRGKGRTRCW